MSEEVAVVGAGNGGLAIAAVMALGGASVRIHDSFPKVVDPIAAVGGVSLKSPRTEGFARFSKISARLSEIVEDVDLVMVVTPASAHAQVAKSLAPCLSPGATVVLNPGRTGGALEVANIFARLCPEKKIVVAEAQTLLFACRKTSPASVVIKGEKRVVPVAAFPATQTPQVVERLRRYFPVFSPASSILETGFSNIGAIFHPTPTLLNTGWIETTHGDFDYYHQGISRGLAELLEKLDAERLSVAQAYAVPVLSAHEWLEEAYNVSEISLYEAIQKNAAYAGIKAPPDIHARYLTEDVPTGLVPISSLGRIANVPTPLMDSIIVDASKLLNIDFRETGRNERNLGLDGLNKDEILTLVREGKRSARQSVDKPRDIPRQRTDNV
jgi:opine dehydrogenase